MSGAQVGPAHAGTDTDATATATETEAAAAAEPGAPAIPVLAIEGEMTIYQAEAVHALLLQGIQACAGPDIELDLAGVTEIDCAGVQLLIAARNFAASRRLALRVVRQATAVQEAFAMLDVAPLFGDALVLPAHFAAGAPGQSSQAAGAAR